MPEKTPFKKEVLSTETLDPQDLEARMKALFKRRGLDIQYISINNLGGSNKITIELAANRESARGGSSLKGEIINEGNSVAVKGGIQIKDYVAEILKDMALAHDGTIENMKIEYGRLHVTLAPQMHRVKLGERPELPILEGEIIEEPKEAPVAPPPVVTKNTSPKAEPKPNRTGPQEAADSSYGRKKDAESQGTNIVVGTKIFYGDKTWLVKETPSDNKEKSRYKIESEDGSVLTPTHDYIIKMLESGKARLEETTLARREEVTPPPKKEFSVPPSGPERPSPPPEPAPTQPPAPGRELILALVAGVDQIFSDYQAKINESEDKQEAWAHYEAFINLYDPEFIRDTNRDIPEAKELARKLERMHKELEDLVKRKFPKTPNTEARGTEPAPTRPPATPEGFTGDREFMKQVWEKELSDFWKHLTDTYGIQDRQEMRACFGSKFEQLLFSFVMYLDNYSYASYREAEFNGDPEMWEELKASELPHLQRTVQEKYKLDAETLAKKMGQAFDDIGFSRDLK